MKFFDREINEVVEPEPIKHAVTLPPIVIQATVRMEINDIEAEQERLSKLLGRKVVIIRYGCEVVRGI